MIWQAFIKPIDQFGHNWPLYSVVIFKPWTCFGLTCPAFSDFKHIVPMHGLFSLYYYGAELYLPKMIY